MHALSAVTFLGHSPGAAVSAVSPFAFAFRISLTNLFGRLSKILFEHNKRLDALAQQYAQDQVSCNSGWQPCCLQTAMSNILLTHVVYLHRVKQKSVKHAQIYLPYESRHLFQKQKTEIRKQRLCTDVKIMKAYFSIT